MCHVEELRQVLVQKYSLGFPPKATTPALTLRPMMLPVSISFDRIRKYTLTLLWPDYNERGFYIYNGYSYYDLRPEVLESNFYAWRATGQLSTASTVHLDTYRFGQVIPSTWIAQRVPTRVSTSTSPRQSGMPVLRMSAT